MIVSRNHFDHALMRDVLRMVAAETDGTLTIPMWKEPQLRDLLEDLTLLSAFGFVHMEIEAEATADKQYFQYKINDEGRAALTAPPILQ
jgi:hypothetical protein